MCWATQKIDFYDYMNCSYVYVLGLGWSDLGWNGVITDAICICGSATNYGLGDCPVIHSVFLLSYLFLMLIIKVKIFNIIEFVAFNVSTEVFVWIYIDYRDGVNICPQQKLVFHFELSFYQSVPASFSPTPLIWHSWSHSLYLSLSLILLCVPISFSSFGLPILPWIVYYMGKSMPLRLDWYTVLECFLYNFRFMKIKITFL